MTRAPELPEPFDPVHAEGASRLSEEGGAIVDPSVRLDGVRCFQRREQKYEVGSGSAALLREEISRRLPVFEFERGHPETYITTIYFDTRARELYRRAEKHYDDNVKIRVKEYFYPLAPDGAQGARRAFFKTSPYCYVEIKQSVGGLVIKKRFGFPKKELRRLLAGEDVLPILRAMNPEASSAHLEDVYNELARYLQIESIGVTSVVCYRRSVFQESEEALRITFDDLLAVYAPPAGLYERFDALVPEVLGAPLRRSDRVILEIKCPGDYPAWLERAMRHYSARRISKFTASVRVLLDGNGAAVPGRSAAGAGESGAGGSQRPPSPEADTEPLAGFFS